ncbi:hypothetical protein VWP48_21845, partial [Xanthomonas citri pv. citri]
IEIIEDCPLQAVTLEKDTVVIDTPHGQFTSRYAVAADGVWSPTRRAIGMHGESPYLGEIHAFRQYFRNVTGIARDQLWVSFERDLLPGYLWSFPSGDGGANVGFGIERKPGQSVQWMKDIWPELLQRPH